MNGSELQPRLATLEDLPRIQKVVFEAYEKYLARMDRAPAPLLEDHAKRILQNCMWVVGTPVSGLICLLPEDGQLLIDDVAVCPDQQGKGVGKLLMQFAEREARRLGFKRVVLYTNEVMTENLAIYSHLGYTETERRLEAGYCRVYMEKQLGQQSKDDDRIRG